MNNRAREDIKSGNHSQVRNDDFARERLQNQEVFQGFSAMRWDKQTGDTIMTLTAVL